MSNQAKTTSLIYGPVPSRRFGLSLGVDLIPRKVCCYDCLYCQVGPTDRLTTEPTSFFAVDEVVRAVELALTSDAPSPEIITLAGSGEPTLFQQLDQVVDGLRALTRLPLALLTNAALLWRPEVAEVAQRFDLVAPSMDAADPETWRRVNRPPPELDFDEVIRGLGDFCSRYTGRLRLEVLLVKDINDSPASLSALAALARSLRVEAVDLNTVVRPPAYSGLQGLNQEEMRSALEYFHRSPAQIVGTYAGHSGPVAAARPLEQICQLVARRPCTTADLHAVLGLEPSRIELICAEAVDRGELGVDRRAEGTYYTARPAE